MINDIKTSGKQTIIPSGPDATDQFATSTVIALEHMRHYVEKRSVGRPCRIIRFIKIPSNDSIKIITRRVKYCIAANVAAHKYNRKLEQMFYTGSVITR